ncbi:sensor histidine kinase [Dyadobacter sp. CY343]|uniref:sensor histidine kinase n=1 Tax=Dyadobacter sp. CY343 TaxID=2907299 RepID=UPI001F294775|nr:histidine kinase [Dyadobacter sp. CY343]MCE7063429.1 histidine kinase [Dyadobacter sp. CY343]
MDIWTKSGFKTRDKYLFLSAVAAGPIWVAMTLITDLIVVPENQLVAPALTLSFLTSIFLGRYFSELIAARFHPLQKLVISLLIALVICNIMLLMQLGAAISGSRPVHLPTMWILFAVTSILLGMVLKLLSAIGKTELREAKGQAAHSQSELHLLQSQLSPHFLFNTLNNLYGLSLTQHEKIPPLLLKLADLLRYSVYDSAELFVPLKGELAYIHNYIDFEKIRIGERLTLVTDIENVQDPSIKVAPMLLIVFIENAFKHSKNTADEQIFIEISLKTFDNYILFSIKNSCGKFEEEENTILRENSGFGLPNVKKRLELLYQNNHELTVKTEPTSYHVTLRLKAK